jgi:hypothetical protein
MTGSSDSAEDRGACPVPSVLDLHFDGPQTELRTPALNVTQVTAGTLLTWRATRRVGGAALGIGFPSSQASARS